MFITSMILLFGFKENTEPQNLPLLTSDTIEVIISDMTVIQGEKGQDTAEVLVGLSQESSEPVTIEYSTEDETAIAGVDYVAAKGTITFEPGDFVKEIKVLIIGEVAADADEDAATPPKVSFRVMITKVKNAIIKKRSAIINIIKNILKDPRFLVPGKSAAYVVELKFKGYTLFHGDITTCPISKMGKVVLSGVLEGYENVGPYDPIMYRGLLELTIYMDICSAENNALSETALCGMRVRFSGNVMTELEIDATNEQCAYIQIHHDPATDKGFYRTVTGGCVQQLADETQIVPNGSIASIFNGRQLKLINVTTGSCIRTLRRDTYYEVDEDGNVMQVRVLRKIR